MGTGRQGPRGSGRSSMHAYWDLSREDSDHIGFSLQPCAIELVRIPHRPDQPPQRALIEVEEMFRDLDMGPACLLTPRLTRIYVGGLDPENPLRLQPATDPSHHGEWIPEMLDHVLHSHHIKRRGLELDPF